MMNLQYESFAVQNFPIGVIGAATGEDGTLCRVFLPGDILQMEGYGERTILRMFFAQLEEYLSGKRRQYDIPYVVNGTDFQIRVWQALTQVPFGQVATYGEIAAMIGKPRAVRAVGGACHANPLPLIIPCHRIVATGGKIGGFGGGIALKQTLLKHEQQDGSRRLD